MIRGLHRQLWKLPDFYIIPFPLLTFIQQIYQKNAAMWSKKKFVISKLSTLNDKAFYLFFDISDKMVHVTDQLFYNRCFNLNPTETATCQEDLIDFTITTYCTIPGSNILFINARCHYSVPSCLDKNFFCTFNIWWRVESLRSLRYNHVPPPMTYMGLYCHGECIIARMLLGFQRMTSLNQSLSLFFIPIIIILLARKSY